MGKENKKIAFVTGAAGFIGRHLVRRLLSEGYSVKALLYYGESAPDDWGPSVDLIEGDVRLLSSLAKRIGRFDVLFHLAAVVSDWGARQEHVDITVHGTEEAIALALNNNATFVVTTSVCAYADALATGLITEQTPVGTPSSHYEFCKQEQERVTLEAVAKHKLRAAIVRPGNVFGVGSAPWVNLLLEMMEQGDPVMLGSGEWDAGLVNVNNLVELMILVTHSDYLAGDIFLGSDGYGVTWKEYLHRLSEVKGAPAPKSIPNLPAKCLAPAFEWLGHVTKREERPLITRQAYRLTGGANIFSTEKAKRLLGYQPPVSFEDAMAELADSFIED